MSLQCPSCSATLPERGFYCATCATQVRCKTCQEVLEPSARACIMCGTLTGTNGTSTQTNGKHAPGINTFELQEDLKSRNVRATVTDHAIAHMGEALAAVLAERITTRPRPPQRAIEHVDTTPPLLPSPPPANAPQEVTATPPSTSPLQGTDQQRLHQIFEYDGEEIRLQKDDLKAESGQDYARRLTYLFLLAHETEGRKPIAYESLKRILDTAKVWDNNTRHALTHKMAVEIEGTMVRLKGAGRKQALTALDEILNPSNTTPGWTPENKRAQASNQRRRPPKASRDASAAPKQKPGPDNGRSTPSTPTGTSRSKAKPFMIRPHSRSGRSTSWAAKLHQQA